MTRKWSVFWSSKKCEISAASPKCNLLYENLEDTKHWLNTRSCYLWLFLSSDKLRLTEIRINVGTKESQLSRHRILDWPSNHTRGILLCSSELCVSEVIKKNFRLLLYYVISSTKWYHLVWKDLLTFSLLGQWRKRTLPCRYYSLD